MIANMNGTEPYKDYREAESEVSQPLAIEVALCRLGKAHAELSDILEMLEIRLASVMRPPENTSREQAIVDQQQSSQLALTLCVYGDEAEIMIYRVSAILRRLEF